MEIDLARWFERLYIKLMFIIIPWCHMKKALRHEDDSFPFYATKMAKSSSDNQTLKNKISDHFLLFWMIFE